MRQVIVRIFMIGISFLLFSGCELQQKNRPSVLVIAVEGLSFESLSCDSDENSDRTAEGMRAFCEEAVRFSHAFAPSTMSQATMASLLTGLYPFDHFVRHNGSDFLSARFHTLAEGALGKGYHTIFISGGAPIWRKSGLAQGFEVFDDTGEISLGRYYRPAGEVVKLAQNWIEHDAGSDPFLGVLFLNDLQFPQIATRTREGEVRERSTDAQLEEVAESLGVLVKWLKQRRRWNSTHIVLVGLNSLEHRETDTDPNPLSLKSASVQVSLFIKPARREGDNVIQWAVDKNVGLVDVGKTMFQWLGLDPPACSVPELEPESLVAAVTKAAPSMKEDRLILTESAWPDWLEGSGVRQAIRQNHFLFIDDKKPKIYNTLTDRLEILPLKSNDPLWISQNAQVVALLKHLKSSAWKGMHPHWPEQIAIASEIWLSGTSDRVPLGPESWSKWYLRHMLAEGNWHEVKRLSQEAGDPVGTFAAGRHLGDNIPVPRNSCLRMILQITSDKRNYVSECEDERLLALHTWQVAKSEEEKSLAQERFMRAYSLHLLDQQIGGLNFLNDLRWDVDRELPDAPQILDYALTLKEVEPFSKKVSAFLSSKDLAF